MYQVAHINKYELIKVLNSAARNRHSVTSLEEIKSELTIVKRMVANIAKQLNSGSEVALQDDVSLPLNTFEQVDRLEQLLEEKSCKDQMTAFLGTIGGVDDPTAVRRIMAALLGNELATKFNWKGLGNKRSFYDLKLREVMAGELLS
ncbi:hypothetical protein AOXY_G33771 [Acipenser oxyrinchus oxyrinchus]|uniref:DUF4806 domain-containing protein n=1 Tax=Acipenser oxyrinchus oxyrinchus TaxID=40147 RepID=A0AAD8CFP6_ACIOX|nr:hypothetical protein AOXY_G33771 [Acipenser oxyrinchus oxyrinchus]